MAPSRLLMKTELAGLGALEYAGRPMLDQFDTLRALLEERFGKAAAQLFAEPIVVWPSGANSGVASWYGPAGGEPRRLTELAGAERTRAETQLRERLRALAPLLSDAQPGAMLRAALTLPSLADVLVVNGAIVLSGWGLAPSAIARDRDQLDSHLRAVLGPFMTIPPLPPAAAAAPPLIPANAPGDGAPLPAAPAAAAVGATAMPGKAPAIDHSLSAMQAGGGRSAGGGGDWDFTPGGKRGRSGGWWFLPFAVVLAALFLATGFYLGWRLIGERMAGMDMTATIVDQGKITEQVNELRERQVRLRKELDEARARLQADICTDANPQGSGPQGAPTSPGAAPTTPQIKPQGTGYRPIDPPPGPAQGHARLDARRI